MLPHILANQRWRALGVLALTGMLQSVCMLLLINWVRRYAEEGIIVSADDWFIVMAAVLVLAGGRYIERYKAEHLAQDYIYSLRQLIYSKANQLPNEDLRIAGKGATLLRLTGDLTAVRNWIVQGLSPLIVIGVWCLISMGALVYLHWLLGVAVLLPLSLAFLGNYLLGRSLFKRSERLRRQRGKMIRNLTEKLRHLHLIRAFNQTGKENRLFLGQARKLRKNQMQRSHISALMRGMNELLLLVTLFALVSSAFMLYQQGQISGELIAILMSAALYLLSQLRRLSRLYEYWTLYRVAEKKLGQFVTRDSLTEGRRKRLVGSFNMRLNRVRVKGRLEKQSLTIGENARVLLTGSSGSGKSTLLSVIAGHTSPDSGKIELCGRRLSSYRASVLSQQICLVSPYLPLLRGTLEENLFYGGRRLSEAYIAKVLELCRLNNVDELPKGMQTRITEDGLNLSSGLRFRVKLGRALLRQPSLLLIDEHAAMNSPEIIEIVAGVSRYYHGSMVICGSREEYGELCADIWAISSNGCSRATEMNNKIIRLEHYVRSD